MGAEDNGSEYHFLTMGVRARPAVLLAIDDYSLPLRRHVCYYMSKPRVRTEAVLSPSRDNPNAPDHIGTHFYGTVLHEADKFRMWYYGLGMAEQPGQLQEGPICYAESEDGLHWIKPALRQVPYKGSLDNNAIALPDPRTEGIELMKEDDDPDPNRRYKAVYESFTENRRWPTIRSATSPDGLHWTAGIETPVDEIMEQSGFYKYNGYYFVNAQMWPRGEGGRKRGRVGHVAVSRDFVHWQHEICESFGLPEPADFEGGGNGKAYDQVHLGVAPVSMGNVLVGLYCIWHSRPNPGDWFGLATTSGDLGIVVSNDGYHFREPIRNWVYLGEKEDPATPAEGYSFPTILEQCNGILNIGEETWIYHGRWRNAPYVNPSITINKAIEDQFYKKLYYAEVGLATLPRDRWGALGLFPESAEGTVWSCPLTLPAHGHVVLNADRAQDIAVEVAGEHFDLLLGYSGAAAGKAQAEGGLECPVAWTQGSLDRLAGETVRFRFHLRRSGEAEPRLYAVYLR